MHAAWNHKRLSYMYMHAAWNHKRLSYMYMHAAACIHANLFMRSHIKQGVKMCIKIKLEAISYFLDDLPQIHHWWDYSQDSSRSILIPPLELWGSYSLSSYWRSQKHSLDLSHPWGRPVGNIGTTL